MSNPMPDAKKENLEAFHDPIKRWAYLIWNAHANDQYQYQGIEDKLRECTADLRSQLALAQQEIEALRAEDDGDLRIWDKLQLAESALDKMTSQAHEADHRAEVALQEIERLTQCQREVEEREAACCPEDVGFDELIGVLRKDIERLKGQVEALKYLRENSEIACTSMQQRAKSLESRNRELRDALGTVTMPLQCTICGKVLDGWIGDKCSCGQPTIPYNHKLHVALLAAQENSHD